MHNPIRCIDFHDVHRDTVSTTPLPLNLFRYHRNRGVSHKNPALGKSYALKD